MAYYAVSNDTVIKSSRKVASSSVRDAILSVPHIEVSQEEALTYINRVCYLRHSIERNKSVFRHYYWTEHNNGQYLYFDKKSLVTADGARLLNDFGHNEHHHSPKRRDEYEARINRERGGRSDLDLARRLNTLDYSRLIDHIFVNENNHWNGQLEEDRLDGGQVSNIWYRFDDINEVWFDHCDGILEHDNRTKPVEHDEYKLTEQEEHFAEDLEKWRSLGG